MKDFLLEIGKDNYNLQIIDFDFAFTSNLSEYVAQKLKIILKIFTGEWYLNNTIGIDYYGKVLVKNPNLGEIEDIYKIKILSVEGTDEITAFNLTFNTAIRQLIVIFTVTLTNGESLTVTV